MSPRLTSNNPLTMIAITVAIPACSIAAPRWEMLEPCGEQCGACSELDAVL